VNKLWSWRTGLVRRVDGTSVLTVYLVLLVCIPSRFVVQGLGGIGAPFALVGLACALWWIWEMVSRSEVRGIRGNPVRSAAVAFFLAVCVSFWVAMRRPINPAELSTADLGLIGALGWLGVLLVAHDGITSIDRFRVFARRIVMAGGGLASLAIAQFVTGRPLTNLISLPGLVTNAPLYSLSSRDGFNRPAGTALHAIEFSVVVTMLLPLALVVARWQDGRPWWRRWYPAAAIACSVPIALSRSALVGAVVGILVLIPALSKAARRAVGFGVGLTLVGVFVLIPGMLGTLIGLFTGISNDDSAASRVDSYGIVWQYFLRHPIFGRGLFTFLPSYRILDNQYLGLLMDVGIVGVVAVLWLFLCGIFTGIRARKVSVDAQLRELCQALGAGVAVGATGFALFDGLGFPMAAGFLFLLLGLAGSAWRLVRLETLSGPIGLDPTVVPTESAAPSFRRSLTSDRSPAPRALL
jgi:hypothetical protein